MYELSRAIYRDLRPFLQVDPRAPGRVERLLIAECEDTVQRMAGGYNLVPEPAAHFFARVRFLFPVRVQAQVRQVAARRLGAIGATLREDPAAYGATNGRRRCRALTVQGQPCQREPQVDSSYCASHRQMAPEALARAL